MGGADGGAAAGGAAGGLIAAPRGRKGFCAGVAAGGGGGARAAPPPAPCCLMRPASDTSILGLLLADGPEAAQDLLSSLQGSDPNLSVEKTKMEVPGSKDPAELEKQLGAMVDNKGLIDVARETIGQHSTFFTSHHSRRYD